MRRRLGPATIALLAGLLLGAWQTSFAACDPAAAMPSVHICAPGSGAAVGSPVSIVAATHDNYAIRATQVYVDGSKMFQGASASLNAAVPMGAGEHRLTVQAVDAANRVFKQTIYVHVSGGTPPITPVASGGSRYQNDFSATSHWIGAESIAPSGAILYGGNQIIPYYSNLAAIGMAKDPARYGQIKNYMQWYVNHLNWPDKWGLHGSIYDYTISGSAERSNNYADSTDSYAATFLSVAWSYYHTGDASAQAYVRTLEYQIESIAGVVIGTQDSDGLTWARPDYHIKYLMDNCEAYRGLRDVAMLFQNAFKDSAKAAYYNARADLMLKGIQGMYLGGAYGVYKDALGRSIAPNWGLWYADATSQMFPVLMGVISPADPHAKAVYASFNSHWPGWAKLSFQGQDPFPWVLVVDAAALMGDTARVGTYMSAVENKYVNHGFPWTWYSAEAGWFMRLNSYLMGRGF